MQHARLRFAQGLVHEEYLLHLFEKVIPYCRAVPYFPKTLHNVTGKFYPSIRFNTCTFACFDAAPAWKLAWPNVTGAVDQRLKILHFIKFP